MALFPKQCPTCALTLKTSSTYSQHRRRCPGLTAFKAQGGVYATGEEDISDLNLDKVFDAVVEMRDCDRPFEAYYRTALHIFRHPKHPSNATIRCVGGCEWQARARTGPSAWAWTSERALERANDAVCVALDHVAHLRPTMAPLIARAKAMNLRGILHTKSLTCVLAQKRYGDYKIPRARPKPSAAKPTKRKPPKPMPRSDPCEYCGRPGTAAHACSHERWTKHGGVHELGPKHAAYARRLARDEAPQDAATLFRRVFIDTPRFRSVWVHEDGRVWVRVKPARSWRWARVRPGSEGDVLAVMRAAIGEECEAGEELIRMMATLECPSDVIEMSEWVGGRLVDRQVSTD